MLNKVAFTISFIADNNTPLTGDELREFYTNVLRLTQAALPWWHGNGKPSKRAEFTVVSADCTTPLNLRLATSLTTPPSSYRQANGSHDPLAINIHMRMEQDEPVDTGILMLMPEIPGLQTATLPTFDEWIVKLAKAAIPFSPRVVTHLICSRSAEVTNLI